MRHFILVQFHDPADARAMASPITELMNRALTLEGVAQVSVRLSNRDLPNRPHLMIEMLLTPEALCAFDASEIHATWKAMYGASIANKVIFDCD